MTKTLPTKSPVDLKSYNTLRLPAVTDNLLLWRSLEELEQLRSQWQPEYPEIMVLGGGSNMVLTRDVGIPCLYSSERAIDIIEESHDYVIIDVGAGYIWDDLVWHCLNQGWYGLENLVSIPGTSGAAPVQNIGAYGRQISDVCLQVNTFDWSSGEKKSYRHEQCNFSYRNSIFKPEDNQINKTTIITSIKLRLDKQALVHIDSRLAHYLQSYFGLAEMDIADPLSLARMITDIRTIRLPDPSVIANVGSFFHNPVISRDQYNSTPELYGIKSYIMGDERVKISAASLLQANNWKGYKAESGAGVSEKHALCLVNNGGANGKDIIALAEMIRQDIYDTYGIKLNIEPAIYT